MIRKFPSLLAMLLVAASGSAQQQGSTNGGFVNDDAGETGPPAFRASGVQGSTAPGGYSAGASAIPAPIVVTDSATEMRENCTPTPLAHVSTVRWAQALSLAAEKRKGHPSHCRR